MLRREFLQLAVTSTLRCPRPEWQLWSRNTWVTSSRGKMLPGDLVRKSDDSLWICDDFGTPRPALNLLSQVYEGVYASTYELLIGSSNRRGVWYEILLLKEDAQYHPIEYDANYYMWTSNVQIIRQVIVDIGRPDLSICKYVWSVKPCLELGRVCSPRWERTKVK